jgi:MoaA/NifB/PqqE/SkfB family radical SAM enzyme
MGVSIEGGEKLHDTITTIPGSFKKTTQGLERLIAHKQELKSKFPLIHLTCVINRGNVMDLVPLYEYANKLGVNVCNFVVSSPATYWHGKDYDQDHHLDRPTAQVEEIEPKKLNRQLSKLETMSQDFKTKLRFSPNYITVEEIVRYYSNKSSYKDYRCFIPWTKVAFSAYGDVFSCPHYRVGNLNDDSKLTSWNSDRIKEFREKLKSEGIFPGCLGCCQSEYIGPTAPEDEMVRIRETAMASSRQQ